MTWEVENTPPPNKVDPLKKSFSGPISNLRTGSVFFGYIDLRQPFPNLFFRLNIPPLKMQDAAQGFRATQPNTGGTTTAFPCWKLRKSVDFLVFSLRLACFFETTGMLGLASTWDEDLIGLVAAAIGTEFKVESICKNPEFHGPNFG